MAQHVWTFILLAVICEGITAGLMEEWSILHKVLWARLQTCPIPLVRELSSCEYCTSFWVALGLAMINFSPVWSWEFWLSLVLLWRLSHYLHSCYTYIVRKALFTGAEVVG